MSTVGIVALVSVGAWLGVLTLVLVLAIRQIGLLTAAINQPHSQPGVRSRDEILNDGLAVGTVAPVAVTAAVPECADGRAYLLLVSSTCNPCRELVAELQRRRFTSEDPLVALVPGPPETAASLAAMLPEGVRAIRDPEAGVLAREHLRLSSAPFALLVEEGIVVGRAYLHGADDLVRFIDSRATSDAGEIARRAQKAKEVAGYVA